MKKMKKGFTLIELMIVIAIISIIAAIAIPNLMQSRIRANEATAVTALKNYCTAQVTFQVGRQGRVPANTAPSGTATAYCYNYPNLFYGNPALQGTAGDTSMNLALISKAHADAWAPTAPHHTAPSNATTTPPTNPSPYQGYQFGNTNETAGDTDFFLTNFSQLGVPSKSSSTGNNAYWVGVEGTVYSQGLAKGALPASSIGMTTPDSDYTAWLNL